jgi:amidase
MRRAIVNGAILTALLLSCAAFGEEPVPSPGRWLITADFYGSRRYIPLELSGTADKMTSKFGTTTITGSIQNGHLHLAGSNSSGDTTDIDATVSQDKLTGTIKQTSPRDTPVQFSFTAEPVPPLPIAKPQRHEFTPTVFYRQFSPFNAPVLRINPGDTVHTTTVDAGGNDEQSRKRVAGGNPQTGPFYVDGAMPGDTLAVHIVRLKLNRDWAGSDDAIVESGLNSDMAMRMKGKYNAVRWRLDREHNLAYTESPGEHLKAFAVPLRPMLGCVATAPGPGGAPPPTGDSGFFGGNMDFNGMTEGTTVYLPVSNPGALLYVGDGHAAMGDGEITGNALETSMDVEFRVDVISQKRYSGIRLEDADSIMTMGLYGSLDDAFKEATSVMAEWLASDYKLTPSEIAQVLGTVAEYRVNEVADLNSGVVLRLPKAQLAGIPKPAM